MLKTVVMRDLKRRRRVQSVLLPRYDHASATAQSRFFIYLRGTSEIASEFFLCGEGSCQVRQYSSTRNDLFFGRILQYEENESGFCSVKSSIISSRMFERWGEAFGGLPIP